MAIVSEHTGTAVVGYFATGHAAHRAINLLIEQGFLPSEIGAAFHVARTAQPAQSGTLRGDNSLRDDLGTTHTEPGHRNSTTFGAPNSGTTAVQPGVLGGGAGTVLGGAGAPGDIPGSSLRHTGLPSELKSEFDEPRTAATWSSQLGHVFPAKVRDASQHPSKESQNFGTGEGSLNLNTAARPYSEPAFERSFTGYGVDTEQALTLARQIGGGGAIVSVHSPARAAEAEQILVHTGGQIRPDAPVHSMGTVSAEEVEIFGTLDESYRTEELRGNNGQYFRE